MWIIFRGLTVYMAALLWSMEPEFKQLCLQLSDAIKTHRKALGISQEQLALRANIDRSYVSQLERGVSNPSLLIVSKVASTLGISLAELFRYVTLPTPDLVGRMINEQLPVADVGLKTDV